MAGPNKLQQLLLANAATDSPTPPSGFSQAVRFAEWNASKTDFYTTFSAFPGTGVANKVYVAIDTGVQYQWKSGAYSAIGGGGAGFTPRGAWVNSTNYAIGDLVTSGGGSFIAIDANINSAPPSGHWQTLALKGDTGAAGATGGTGAGYGGTSATSLTIGTGARTLTTQAGLAYVPSARIRVGNGANWMEGNITDYNSSSGSLTFTSDHTGGSGTFTSWSLSIAGNPGGSDAVYNLGSNLAGTIAPDFANGRRQYCSLNGDSTISPTGGSDMDELLIGIAYTNGAYLLNFSGVKMPPAVAALLPVTLEQYRCYLITLRYLGGGWTLMDISEANIESED